MNKITASKLSPALKGDEITSCKQPHLLPEFREKQNLNITTDIGSQLVPIGPADTVAARHSSGA
jgi:hypothetical protein